MIQIYFSGLALDNHISGPSDVGGICPNPTYEFLHYDNKVCCCGDGCCWDRCILKVPPKDCLKEVSTAGWKFNAKLGYYQAIRGGKA